MMPRQPLPYPNSLQSLWAIVLFSIRQTLLRKKTLAVGLVALLPPIFIGAVLLKQHGTLQAGPMEGTRLYELLYSLVYQGILMFLVPLMYAVSLFGDELDAGTLQCLLTRPISKTTVLLGKLIAYVVVAFALFVPSLGLTALLLQGAGIELFLVAQDALVLAMGFLVYGAVFTLLGLALKRPTIVAVLLITWEYILSRLPGLFNQLTALHYLYSCSRIRPDNMSFPPLPSPSLTPYTQAIEALAVITVVSLAAAAFIFGRREPRGQAQEG